MANWISKEAFELNKMAMIKQALEEMAWITREELKVRIGIDWTHDRLFICGERTGIYALLGLRDIEYGYKILYFCWMKAHVARR